MFNSIKNKGFTLIELLVVIAIIGILATIVIVNVNSARTKALDTAVTGSLDALRSSAELYYGTSTLDTYAGFCGSVDAVKAFATIESNNGQGASSVVCNITAAGDAYAISAAERTSGKFWCIDSIGNSESENANLAAGVTVCPPSS